LIALILLNPYFYYYFDVKNNKFTSNPSWTWLFWCRTDFYQALRNSAELYFINSSEMGIFIEISTIFILQLSLLTQKTS